MFNEQTTDILDVLPYFSFEDDSAVMKDGRIAIACSFEGVQEESWSEKDYQLAGKTFESALKKLSPGTCITKTDIHYPSEKEEIEEEGTTYLDKKEREYFKNSIKLKGKSYMFFTFLPGSVKKSTALNNTFTAENVSNKNLKTKDLNKLRELANKEFEEFHTILEGIENISLKRLTEEEFELLAYQFLNLDFDQEAFELYNEIDNSNPNQMVLGNKMVKNITLKGQAEEIEFANLKSYTENGKIPKSWIFPLTHELRVPHITTQTMQILVKEKALSGFDKEVEIVGGLINLIPRLANLAPRNGQIVDFLEEIRLREVGLVNFGLQVTLFSENLEEHKKSINLTKNAFNKINHSTYILESFDNTTLFFACLPGNASDMYRTILMPMDVAAAHFNLTQEFRGDQTGVSYLNRHGTPIRFEYDHRLVDKKNELVIGPTRSGKSFSIGHRILDYYLNGNITLIIDKGGTYKNLINNLDGRYLENSEENPIRINPLLLDKDDNGYILSKDDMIYLKTFFMIIWKNREKGEIASNAEDAALMWIIEEYYKKVNLELQSNPDLLPKLKHFYDWYKGFIVERKEKNDENFVEFENDFDFINFLNVLKPFAHGNYAKIFDVEDNKLLSDEKLICFDLGNLDKDPFIFRIMTTVIIQLILNYIKRFPDKKKWIPIDEAWSLFTGEMGDFIAYMFRTILKANGKSTVITQGAEDFAKCPIGHILVDNAGILTILNHAGQDYDKLQDILSLTDHEINLIKSIRMMKGREQFVRHQELRSTVLLLEACPHEYAILTSQPDERNHLVALKEKYGNIWRATDEWVKDFEAGAIRKN